MKTKNNMMWLGSLTAATILSFSSCENSNMNNENTQYASVIDVANDGTTLVNDNNLVAAFVETPLLADNEVTLLQKMKDEEKLARDVYQALYTKYNNTVFSRIANAESKHLNAIVLLLKNYNNADTIIAEAGVFKNPDVQTLYNNLITKASESIEEGFKTGALIEEMDIKDLNNVLAVNTNANVKMVFENLQRGSRNHLRAFNRQLTALGTVYTPVYLSQTEYNAIVNSAVEKGKLYKMKGKGKEQGKGKNGKGNKNDSCSM